MRVKWYASEEHGTIDVDDDDIRAAYEKGGMERVQEMIQEGVDAYCRNNLFGTSDHSEVEAEVQALLGKS